MKEVFCFFVIFLAITTQCDGCSSLGANSIRARRFRQLQQRLDTLEENQMRLQNKVDEYSFRINELEMNVQDLEETVRILNGGTTTKALTMTPNMYTTTKNLYTTTASPPETNTAPEGETTTTTEETVTTKTTVPETATTITTEPPTTVTTLPPTTTKPPPIVLLKNSGANSSYWSEKKDDYINEIPEDSTGNYWKGLEEMHTLTSSDTRYTVEITVEFDDDQPDKVEYYRGFKVGNGPNYTVQHDGDINATPGRLFSGRNFFAQDQADTISDTDDNIACNVTFIFTEGKFKSWWVPTKEEDSSCESSLTGEVQWYAKSGETKATMQLIEE